MGVDGSRDELTQQTLSERPQATAAIEGDQCAVSKPSFNARGVPALAGIPPFGARDGPAHAPKLNNPVGPPSLGPSENPYLGSWTSGCRPGRGIHSAEPILGGSDRRSRCSRVVLRTPTRAAPPNQD
jgi:hypothetical protein